LLETKEYWSYSKEFGKSLMREECINEIYNIFHKYKRELFINCISHIAINFGVNNDEEMIKKIQKSLFGIEINKYFVHRSALNVIYQLLLEYRDFSKSDDSKIIDPNELVLLFLLVNELLDIEYEGVRIDTRFDDTQKLIFYGIKLFYGIVSPDDVQAKSFYFGKLYESIYKSKKFKNEIKLFESDLGVSYRHYRKTLKWMAERKRTKSIYKILVGKFSIDINEIENKWDNRSIKLPVPFDFKFLIDYPIVISRGKKYVLNSYFLFLALITKCYHMLSNKDTSPNFRGLVNKDIFENIIKNFLKNIFVFKKVKELNLLYDRNKEYADWGMVFENFIILFEIKSGTIAVEKKYGKDIEAFYKDLSKKYIDEQGIRQQIKGSFELDKNFDSFCEINGLERRKEYILLPVLLVYDDIFEIPGVNDYMRQKYLELVSKKKTQNRNFLLSANDAIITFTDLFVLSRKKFKRKEDVINKLIGYFRYRLPFRMYLEDKQTQ
jgi:hypothetical protein